MLNEEHIKFGQLEDNTTYRVCLYDKCGRPIKYVYLDTANIFTLLYFDLYKYDTEIYKINRGNKELDIFINNLDTNINFNQLFDRGLTVKEINEYFKERSNLLCKE